MATPPSPGSITLDANLPGAASYCVGVDLGGTKILAGVFNELGECLGKVKMSTKAGRGHKAVLERVLHCITEAVDEADLQMNQVSGVGIGAPGTVDPKKGEVIFAPNLEWHNVKVSSFLESKLNVPCVLENDTNACMLGVYEVELKRQFAQALGIFIGTGIGGGLVLNGNLYTGASHGAGEVGHMILDLNGPQCGCGNRGCFEALAGKKAIYEKIFQAIRQGRKTVLTEILGDEKKELRSGDLKRALKRRDELVLSVVRDAARVIGTAIVSLCHILNPQIVILGGGVIDALGKEMMPEIISSVRSRLKLSRPEALDIRMTALGDDAGITGAGVLAWKHLREKSEG